MIQQEVIIDWTNNDETDSRTVHHDLAGALRRETIQEPGSDPARIKTPNRLKARPHGLGSDLGKRCPVDGARGSKQEG